MNLNFNERSIDEWFDIFSKNEKIPDEILMEYAKKYKIDLSMEERFLKADLAINTQGIAKAWNEWKAKKKTIEEGNKEYDELLKKLESGEKEYVVKESEFVGGKDLKELKEYYRCWNFDFSYDEAIKSRKQDLTRELYDNLDHLTLFEIKERYFGPEEYDDGCDE